MVQLDFVFIIRLRYVNKTSTLPELITNQHDKLNHHDVQALRSILNGRTNHKVLLLIDGYDEYEPGTNREVDKAIEITLGNCLLLLTSRPGFLKKPLRDKMDEEIIIQGLSQPNITRCAQLYLGNERKCSEMLKQAKVSGVEALLHVPIILLMVCTIFVEENMLPRQKTDIVGTIFKLAIARGSVRTSDKTMDTDLLFVLGKFSWEALHKETGQLQLDKVRNFLFSLLHVYRVGYIKVSIIFFVIQQEELEQKLPAIMKLGLLIETFTDVATVKEQRKYVCFVHKIFQDYTAGYFVAKTVEMAGSKVL